MNTEKDRRIGSLMVASSWRHRLLFFSVFIVSLWWRRPAYFSRL